MQTDLNHVDTRPEPSTFDVIARAMDLASLLAGSVGMSDVAKSEAYAAALRSHLAHHLRSRDEAIRALQAELEAAQKDAERWRHASTSRNFGIANWTEFGQRTSYAGKAEELVDAALAKEQAHG